MVASEHLCRRSAAGRRLVRSENEYGFEVPVVAGDGEQPGADQPGRLGFLADCGVSPQRGTSCILRAPVRPTSVPAWQASCWQELPGRNESPKGSLFLTPIFGKIKGLQNLLKFLFKIYSKSTIFNQLRGDPPFFGLQK